MSIEEDLKRVEEITEEALHPTSPFPGHAEGCPCHRCRMYVVGEMKRIAAKYPAGTLAGDMARIALKDVDDGLA